MALAGCPGRIRTCATRFRKSRVGGEQCESALTISVVGLGVHLERAELGVTQDVRDEHGVSATAQQLGREGVSEDVWTEAAGWVVAEADFVCRGR
jgi:hypothetical protein